MVPLVNHPDARRRRELGPVGRPACGDVPKVMRVMRVIRVIRVTVGRPACGVSRRLLGL